MNGEPTKPKLADRVRLFFEAANRRDLETVMSVHAPDAVYELSQRGLGIFEGASAIRGFLEDYLAAFDSVEWEVQEMFVLDNRVVLLVVRQQGRPAGVRARVWQTEAWVQRYSADGMLEQASSYVDPGEGRAAAKRLAASGSTA